MRATWHRGMSLPQEHSVKREASDSDEPSRGDLTDSDRSGEDATYGERTSKRRRVRIKLDEETEGARAHVARPGGIPQELAVLERLPLTVFELELAKLYPRGVEEGSALAKSIHRMRRRIKNRESAARSRARNTHLLRESVELCQRWQDTYSMKLKRLKQAFATERDALADRVQQLETSLALLLSSQCAVPYGELKEETAPEGSTGAASPAQGPVDQYFSAEPVDHMPFLECK
jgi:hypothetical protein